MAPQPFIPLENGAQVQLVSIFAVTPGFPFQYAVPRLWFVRRQGTVNPTTLAALVTGVASWWVSQVVPFLSKDLYFHHATATDWTAAGGASINSTELALPGGVNEASHSANVAYRVRFKPEGPVRGFYNANFVGGLPIGSVDTNTVRTELQDALLDAYANLIDLAAVFGPFPAWDWVCTSRREGNEWRSTQFAASVAFIEFPSPYVSPRRHRMHNEV